MGKDNGPVDMVQGTLDMLILQALRNDVLHGFAIAQVINQRSSDHIKVETGSLYPALHRIERRGWITAEWGLSESNRRAKYYRITHEGKKQLKVEISRWNQMVAAISAILNPPTEEATFQKVSS